MLGSLPKIPMWKADESGFESQLSDSKAFVLPTKHTVNWNEPPFPGRSGTLLASSLVVSCSPGTMWHITSRLPTPQLWSGTRPAGLLLWPSLPAHPGSAAWCGSNGPPESGATLIILLGFPHTPSWALLLQLLCSVMSPMFQLSASPSPLIIPFLSSLHLPNKIEQKTKQQKIKLQFSHPCHKSQNLNSCFLYEVPNPSLLLPLYLHLLPTLDFWSVAGGLSNWVVS